MATHQGTRAYFNNYYSVSSGTISAVSLLSPAIATSRTGGSTTAMEISRWSDVSFLIYQQMARAKGYEVNSLRKIEHSDITNVDTKTVIQAVCASMASQAPNPCPPPKGSTPLKFDVTSANGMALLGTPNARGAAWMLAERRTSLPGKSITSIEVTSTNPQLKIYNMVINIG